MGGEEVYYIAVCDDDKNIGGYIERVILNYGKRENIKFEVDVYFTGEGLIASCQQGEHYDLIFLDIQMEGSTGIEIGNHIRNQLKNDLMHIIYISAHSNYALELFKIRPLDFLIKPFGEKEILDDLKKAIELSNYKGQFFSYTKNWETYKIPLKDILYFKSSNKEVEIYYSDGKDVFYSSLESIYKEVAKWRFFYCHQSYLVNYNQVTVFRYDQLTLKNGEVLGISQGKRKRVRQILQEYEKEDL